MSRSKPKSLRKVNPIVLYDRDKATVLRVATTAEVDEHYQNDDRDAVPLYGEPFGFPGTKIWLAHLDPREIILGWTPDGHPIFRGWKYRGWEKKPNDEDSLRQVLFTCEDALRFADEATALVLSSGASLGVLLHGPRVTNSVFVDGAKYNAKGLQIKVDYKKDLGLPPQPIIDHWRATYWHTDGSVKSQPQPTKQDKE
jgi:hypothetical protein